MNRFKLELCLLWIGWIFVSIKIWKQISIVLTYGSFLFLPVHIRTKFSNFTTSLLIDSNKILISKSIGFSYFSKIKHSSIFDFLSFFSNFQESTFSKVWNFVLKATNFISILNGSKHNSIKLHKNLI